MTERTKPEFDAPTGPAPADLEVRDILVGDGAEAKPGDTVTVHYAGVEFDSGEEFDSSWGRGETIQFPLRGLIQGWQSHSLPAAGALVRELPGDNLPVGEALA